MASPLDPPAQPSALPSPPTSPTSPRTATARVRIKASRRPNSICYVPSLASKSQLERTRSTSPSLSRIATTDLDMSGSETTRTSSLASASVVADKRSRRQSSITYYTPSSPAPWSQRPQLNRTLSSSVVNPHDAEPPMANGKENVLKRSSLVLSSRSPSTRESVSSVEAAGAREREPFTLVEKHADLLHFIAQKERKCLELRDQLATHEKELAELKRKWERIVNRGHDPLQSPPSAGIGGVTLDGLKEGVRMIAAGFSDLGGVIPELESCNDSSKHKSPTHAPRENGTSNARVKRFSGEHFSMSSMSFIQESAHPSDHVLRDGGLETIPSSLARAGSLNAGVHKRASRVVTKAPSTPPSGSVSPPAQSPRSSNLDVGMSIVLTPSPTLVPPLLDTPSAFTSAPKSPVMGSTHGPALVSAGPVSSWMDSMGKKLSGLQKGQTFSKSQKRTSSLLAGVSSTISTALLPGPTATTPAPFPTSSTGMPRVLTATTSPVSTKLSLATRPSLSAPHPGPATDSRAYPSYTSITDWLDDDEEQTMHAGVPGMVPVPDATVRLHIGTDGPVVGGRAEGVVAVSAFNDDWNW